MPVAEFQPQQGVHIETDPTKTDKAGSGDDASIIDGMVAQLRVSPTAAEAVHVLKRARCWLCSLVFCLCGTGLGCATWLVALLILGHNASATIGVLPQLSATPSGYEAFAFIPSDTVCAACCRSCVRVTLLHTWHDAGHA